MNYFIHILIIICIYLILSSSLNLLIGYTGLLSVCHAAFYGLGAYTSTLTMMKLGLPYLVALFLSIFASMLIAVLIAIPSIRLKGDYFILATIGFQIIVFRVLYNWIDLTRGPYGIPGIPQPVIFGFELSSYPAYFCLSLILAVFCLGLKTMLVSSPFGRLLKGIRDDEIATQSLGKDIVKTKITIFAIAGGMAAVAGSLFAHYVTYIDPTSFTLDESIFIISIIIIGGLGNIKGPIVGTILLLLIPEILRFLRIPDSVAANVRQMIYAVLLIVFMRIRPEGIAGVYKFE